MAYSNTTRATLRQRCRERLLTNFWTDAEINAYINEALRVWSVLTGYWRQTSTYVVPAGTTYLNLNTALANYLSLQRIELSNYHLNLVSLKELDSLSYNWQCESGIPREAAIVGLNNIAFHPHPSVDTTMYFTYVRTAPLPTADGDFINLSEEELSAIRNYVQFIATVKEGGMEMQSSLPLFKEFLKECERYNAKLNKLSSFHKLLGWAGYGVARPVELEATPRTLDADAGSGKR